MLEKRNKPLTGKMGGALKPDGTEMGQIRIHENVIASIVRRTTCGIKGVKRLSGSHIVDNIAELIRNKRIGDRAIVVNLEGENVSIEVKVNFEYGAHIPTVASNIQSLIAGEVEKLTGLNVTGVTVIVHELEDAIGEER
jgi:uncharacterized alkaline shock family protein YloU